MSEFVEQVMQRTGQDENVVKDLASRLDAPGCLAVIEYLEHRLEVMVGDENAAHEIYQIMRDLSALVTARITG